jgi:periplasmic divalent cation tolerance protein
VSSTDGSGVVLVLTTLGADADAAALARTLVEERLAACVNILPPMRALETRLRTLHPYELPEFLVLPAGGGSAAYLAWVGESIG